MWILGAYAGGSRGKIGLRRSAAHLGLALIATQSVAAPASKDAAVDPVPERHEQDSTNIVIPSRFLDSDRSWQVSVRVAG
jgi:hypothetical protein